MCRDTGPKINKAARWYEKNSTMETHPPRKRPKEGRFKCEEKIKYWTFNYTWVGMSHCFLSVNLSDYVAIDSCSLSSYSYFIPVFVVITVASMCYCKHFGLLGFYRHLFFHPYDPLCYNLCIWDPPHITLRYGHRHCYQASLSLLFYITVHRFSIQYHSVNR